ncbi:MAG: hypothetical protein HY814_08610 [Candidatus Riflebacteria bacterium]|nr:hypothetical protein [Candidatus Riflebacteria bacterium]
MTALAERPGFIAVAFGVLLGLSAVQGHVTFGRLLLLYVALVSYCLFRVGQRSAGLARARFVGNPEAANDLLALVLGLAWIAVLAWGCYRLVAGTGGDTYVYDLMERPRFWVVCVVIGLLDILIARAYEAEIGDR